MILCKIVILVILWNYINFLWKGWI